METLLVEKKSGPDIIVEVKGVAIGGKQKIILSGPCAVEDQEGMLAIGKRLKEMGVHLLRGGAFKPRTSPYDFQGLQYEGIKILHEVGREVGLPIVTEIMEVHDIEKCLPFIDMIQIGSRNMYNYSLLKEVGKLSVPVLLKRGMSATLKEWLYAAEYILSNGNSQVVLCERGIRTFETYTRNTLDLNSVAAIKQNYRLPVIVDPSHGTGRRELVAAMSRAAIAAGADGLMLESHREPACALSDAMQTIDLETVKEIIEDTRKLEILF